jgi:prepilin peptidase CpaA
MAETAILMDASLFKLCSLGLLAGLLALAVRQDVASFKIPNALVACGMAAALALHGLAGEGLLHAVGGLAAGLALLLPLYMAGAAGAGDVKLMGMVGAFLGPVGALGAALATFVAGMALALLAFLRPGVYARASRNLRLIAWGAVARLAAVGGPRFDPATDSAAKLPYSLAIAVGSLAFAGWRAWS